MCLNFGKFSQVLAKIQIYGCACVQLENLSQLTVCQIFQLETWINWRIICTWKFDCYCHNDWNQNNSSNNRSWNKKYWVKSTHCISAFRIIMIRSWFETILDFKPRILDPNVEEFSCLVHKGSFINDVRYFWVIFDPPPSPP